MPLLCSHLPFQGMPKKHWKRSFHLLTRVLTNHILLNNNDPQSISHPFSQSCVEFLRNFKIHFTDQMISAHLRFSSCFVYLQDINNLSKRYSKCYYLKKHIIQLYQLLQNSWLFFIPIFSIWFISIALSQIT